MESTARTQEQSLDEALKASPDAALLILLDPERRRTPLDDSDYPTQAHWAAAQGDIAAEHAIFSFEIASQVGVSDGDKVSVARFAVTSSEAAALAVLDQPRVARILDDLQHPGGPDRPRRLSPVIESAVHRHEAVAHMLFAHPELAELTDSFGTTMGAVACFAWPSVAQRVARDPNLAVLPATAAGDKLIHIAVVYSPDAAVMTLARPDVCDIKDAQGRSAGERAIATSPTVALAALASTTIASHKLLGRGYTLGHAAVRRYPSVAKWVMLQAAPAIQGITDAHGTTILEAAHDTLTRDADWRGTSAPGDRRPEPSTSRIAAILDGHPSELPSSRTPGSPNVALAGVGADPDTPSTPRMP